MKKMKQNETLQVQIESLAFEGYGIAKKDNFVYFVKKAIPGDTAEIMVTKKKKKYAFANLMSVIEPSEDRAKPRCDYFGECGGCSLQNLDYTKQIYWKNEFVRDALRKFAHLSDVQINPALGCPEEYNYRNKMEFSFSAHRWLSLNEINSQENIDDKNFALGLHSPQNFAKVIDIQKCHLQDDDANIILNFVRDYAKENGLAPLNNFEKSGLLKNLVIRYSKLQNAFMVLVITGKASDNNEEDLIKELIRQIKQNFSKVISCIWAVNDSLSPVAKGEINLIEGEQFIYEEILGIKFRISPFSFFQTNPYQLDNFVGKILEIADLQSNDVVYDLYCGAGSLTLPASKQVNHIYGFELVAEAIEDAKLNASENNIENAKFEAIDLHHKHIDEYLKNYPAPNTIILDPPRAGMHKNIIDLILKLQPQKIVYVSCNPTTQARDLEFFLENYSVEDIQPIDMFPQTYHIENVIKLIRN